MPAWPIPIHQTKLVIAKPHATGTLMPQIPTPNMNRYVITTFSSRNRQTRNREADDPARGRAGRQHDGADLVGDGSKRMTRAR